MYKRTIRKLTGRAVCVMLIICLIMSFTVTAFAASGTVYESENNNSYLYADRTYDDYDAYGLINSPGDVDYWVISFPNGGTANFFLGNIPSGKDYDMYIYSSNGTSLLRSSTRSGTANELISMSVSGNTNYYVKIVSATGSSTTSYYLLRAKVYSSRTLQIPLYQQQETDTCGSACGRMILEYYGIYTSEASFKSQANSFAETGDDYTYVYAITRALNHYLENDGNLVRYHYKYVNSLSEQEYTTLMTRNILNNRPVQLPMTFGTNSYFPYQTGGHYMVLKGMNYNTTTVAYDAILNDPYYGGSSERTVPISTIRSYNLAHSGCIICVID